MYPLRFLLHDAGGSNPRLALAAVRALADETEWLLVRAVRLARAEGCNWAQIGRLLGPTPPPRPLCYTPGVACTHG